MDHWLAVDFGTSNSLVVAAKDSRVSDPLEIDPGNSDPTILKSVLYSPERGVWEFGDAAIRRYYEEGAHGRIFKSLKKFLPDPGFQGTEVHGAFLPLEVLLAHLLKTIRERAEAIEGRAFSGLLCGHPALFSKRADYHKLALDRLEKAARLAGFTAVEFCPEPVAAAQHFVATLDRPQLVMIADFGGGTSDFTIVRMQNRNFDQKDVLAIGGVSIAGDAFDSAIMEHVVAPHFGSKISYSVPLGSNVLTLPKALVRKMYSPADLLVLARRDYVEFFQRLELWSVGADTKLLLDRLRILVEEREGYHLFQCIEEGKKSLGESDVGIIDYEHGEIALHLEVPKTGFETFSKSLLDAILHAMDETIKSAGIVAGDIDAVCCTGGTARLDIIKKEFAQRFSPEKLREHLPFHAVIRGLGARLLDLA